MDKDALPMPDPPQMDEEQKAALEEAMHKATEIRNMQWAHARSHQINTKILFT